MADDKLNTNPQENTPPDVAALLGSDAPPEQDRRLAELHQTGASYGEIAVALQRSTSAIRSRLKKQGLLETK